ncbi:hypothetical protein ACFWTE_07040 [Nocardiopsis sp. NPDC058631]|uniref:hypothetical protein n=1 Tax=Nocardiopsis sp. NPDC058631 TaxID=3346566 RepID=UPI0036684618
MNDPRIHWKTTLTMGVVMVPLVIVISLTLAFLTSWPTWLTSAVGGGVSGLVSPFVVHWILNRRGRVQDRPAPSTER